MAALRLRAVYPICRLLMVLFSFGFLGNIIKILPKTWTGRLAKTLHREGQFDPNGPISPDDLLQGVGSWGNVKYMVRTYFREAIQGFVCLGEKVPNVELMWMKQTSVDTCRLLDFEKAGRPLVLNMGSCS